MNSVGVVENRQGVNMHRAVSQSLCKLDEFTQPLICTYTARDAFVL
jgi:hypothetical protein